MAGVFLSFWCINAEGRIKVGVTRNAASVNPATAHSGTKRIKLFTRCLRLLPRRRRSAFGLHFSVFCVHIFCSLHSPSLFLSLAGSKISNRIPLLCVCAGSFNHSRMDRQQRCRRALAHSPHMRAVTFSALTFRRRGKISRARLSQPNGANTFQCGAMRVHAMLCNGVRANYTSSWRSEGNKDEKKENERRKENTGESSRLTERPECEWQAHMCRR